MTRSADPPNPAWDAEDDLYSTHIAVIGLACRFPGADTVAEFWHNLSSGVDSVTRFPPRSAAGPGGGREYVPGGGVLRSPEWFDAGYFGYTPREALLIDPQHRVLLECAVEALDSAGYDPGRYPGSIGVYAGCSESSYARILRARRDDMPSVTDWDIRMGTAADFLCSKVAYKLGTRGPAVAVQAACATSLVAVHLAAQALLAGECDLALAGGTSVHVPPRLGRFTTGGILSPTGTCRAFDASADGVIGGQGCGIAVLKRLSEALADGDHVHAVVRGTAVNNDGAGRVGFTAPGVEGQADVIRAAQRVAGVRPSSITYVEAHGTATPVGDPIEVAALTRAFGESARQETCWLGSVKTNIGHTDAAAGIAGFIKTVLAVEHGVIPPSLHFTEPNPDIDFDASPFAVVTEPRRWAPAGLPRRAGVSSFGLGGTNAHVVLEQRPAPAPRGSAPAEQVLVLSARTPAALDATTRRLAEHLDRHPEQALADVAWTLQVGRRRHGYRRYAVVTGRDDAVHVLTGGAPERLVTGDHAREDRPVALLFPDVPAHDRADQHARARWWAALGLDPDLALGRGSGASTAAALDLPGTCAGDAAPHDVVLTEHTLAQALADPARVFVEIGDGALCAALADHPLWTNQHVAVVAADPLAALGELWLAGVEVRWDQVHRARRARVPLPTYPFQRQRFLVESEPEQRRVAGPDPLAGAGRDTAHVVSGLFTEMLGIHDIDPDDSFFDLGGDSLVATRLVARVGEIIPVVLDLRSVYVAPSVRELAALIDARLAEGATAAAVHDG
ncbi:beta-ketoacyl synthase N-terminal-like domain-containing protein [Actinosynnema sp. NPDC023794]